MLLKNLTPSTIYLMLPLIFNLLPTILSATAIQSPLSIIESGIAILHESTTIPLPVGA